jgi:hypothetical protein
MMSCLQKNKDEWAARHPDGAWYILTLTCVATLTISGQSQKKYEIYSKKCWIDWIEPLTKVGKALLDKT